MKIKINRRKVMNITGIALIIVAIVLIFLTFLFKVDAIAEKYQELLVKLAELENFVASLPNKWLVLLAIILLFALKTFVPIPLSTVCFIAGVVFPSQYSFIINLSGVTVLLTTKYFMGKRFGGGAVEKLYKKNEAVTTILHSKGDGNPWLLVVLRITPFFPINLVSQIYGSMNCEYDKYLVLSLLGFLPKILSYTIIGQNIYNPFSAAFILPIVILLIISGVSLISFNMVLEYIQKPKVTKNNKSILKGDK